MYICEYSTIRSNWGSKLGANIAKQKRLRSNGPAAESPPDDQKPKRAMASSPSRPKPEDSALSAASASRNLDGELASTIEEEESSNFKKLKNLEDTVDEESRAGCRIASFSYLRTTQRLKVVSTEEAQNPDTSMPSCLRSRH